MRSTALLSLLLAVSVGQAQQRTTTPPSADAASGQAATRTTGIRPYSEIITQRARTSRGIFTIHRVDDKYFFEIPDTLMRREILVVNRIAKAPVGGRAGFLGYAGDQIADNVITFERGPNNRVFLRTISYQERAMDSTQGMYRSVMSSNLQPISASFEVRSLGRDSSGVVIDVTEYLMGDNEVLFFNARNKRALGLSSYQRENSYILDVKAFPESMGINTVKTYLRTPQPVPGQPTTGAFAPSSAPATFELNSSMILLPRTPMQPRLFDPRVGYFSTGYTDFDLNPQGIERVRMITRWRLEPKPQDVDRYKRGELVEPQKPIVFYIDPATPKAWIPYLIQGVNDWQVAFEKAGFKNAIMGQLAPANNPEWYIENPKYSAIVYKPSDIPNASGPHVHDPRSGEILESHINWYHNVMNLLRNWYFIQAAAVDPRARNLRFNDSLMGQLIRFVSSHEVGHTLGLRHNFGSSSTVPVENLRNKAWVEANGHTPSIMDYARFNYVAQPEDNISEKGLFPRIGDYDLWAIEWGYRWFPEANSPETERPILNRLTIDKLKNKRLIFLTESDPDDPRGQSEDIGDNAMKASAYGIKNLQRIVTGLPQWTREPNRGFESLNELYGNVVSQFNRYMGHVSKNIGGIMTTPRTVEQEGVVLEFVPQSRQKEAMQFLQDQLFKTPRWLIAPQIANLTGTNALTTINGLQDNTLARLTSHATLNKLLRSEAEQNNAYTANEMLTDLRRGIWSELTARQPIDIYRRNLQKSFVERMVRAIVPEASSNSQGGAATVGSSFTRTTDAISLAKAQLRSLQADIRAALPTYKDAASRAHLQDVNDRITMALDPTRQ